VEDDGVYVCVCTRVFRCICVFVCMFVCTSGVANDDDDDAEDDGVYMCVCTCVCMCV